ncbi:magnesium-transporting ATPase [Fibrobacteria bacterium R8-3-H12]
MTSQFKKTDQFKKVAAETKYRDELRDRMKFASTAETDSLFRELGTTQEGLSEELVEKSRERYGSNRVTRGKKLSLAQRLAKAFINPFTVILFCLAVFSSITDIIMPIMDQKEFAEAQLTAPQKTDLLGAAVEEAEEPDGPDPLGVIIISVMVMISGILRFVQETRSGHAAENLLKLIKTTTNVQRKETGNKEIPLDEVVVGDIVHLAAGDMVPADMRIIQAKDLFISQAALTGESLAVEKIPGALKTSFGDLTEVQNLAYMGTDVLSGSATGVVVITGNDTIFGEMAKGVNVKPVKTGFEKGVNSVSWVLIRFMLCMVPCVLLINGFTKGDWWEAALFALSIAVGLTPEMLPMIVTSCLAKGAVAMSRKKTIIKNLNSMQNVGAIDILCTDKTGTLTQDKVVLMYHLDIQGQENMRVLRHAFLNSYYQTGLRNLMDIAIINKVKEERTKEDDQLRGLVGKYTKVDEIPFDFERRRMSVVVARSTEPHTELITKGAIEEMLSVCKYAEYQGKVEPLTEEIRDYIIKKVEDLNEDGMRVLAVAEKINPSPAGQFSVADESDMTLLGYLAFLDPPKESTPKAIRALKEHGVGVKVLTGDNDKVTRTICKQVGLPVDRIMNGWNVDRLGDKELSEAVEKVDVFAKLSPQQKSRVVTTLRNNGHSVGYMGDGINDAAAMKASDVGISVDSAVDIAKESADVILLEKDLMVLEEGIIEGRKTYGNMIKYIKMTASSNFGNMFSVLAASAFLPFMPMLSIHILFLNLIYDISCTSIPWDNVDKEFLVKPRKWDASSLGKFMIWIGPTSSVFDLTTYLLMYFVICPPVIAQMFGLGSPMLFHQLTDPAMMAAYAAVFQAGWFVESMWSQTLVIHMIRTPKIPFIQSRASFPLMTLTFTGIFVLTCIPFTGFGKSIGLLPLPPVYFAWLALTIFLYMALATCLKKAFIRHYGELL